MFNLIRTMRNTVERYELEQEYSIVTYKTSISDRSPWNFSGSLIRERSGTTFNNTHLNKLKGASFIADEVGIFGLIDDRLVLIFQESAAKDFCFIETDTEGQAHSFIFGLKLNRHVGWPIFNKNYTDNLSGVLHNCRKLQKTHRLRGIWVPLGGFCAEF